MPMEGSLQSGSISHNGEKNGYASLQKLLHSQAVRTPDVVAFITADGRQCTFGDWDNLSSLFALKLRAAGVQPCDLVTILTEQTPEYYIGVFGILKLGAAFVPLDTRSPVERSVSIIRDHGIKVLVATEHHTSLLKEMDLEGITTLTVPQQKKLPHVEFEMYDSQPDDPCYNICTSGSTGKPKGVLVAHKGMCNIISWLDEKTPMKVGDIAFTAFALHFDGFLLVFHALAYGSTLFMFDSALFLDMKAVSKQLIKHRVNYITGVPTWTNLLFSYVESEKIIMPDMRYVLCGGEVASFAMVKRIAAGAPNSLFINIYGPTETTVFCIAHVCDPKTETAPPPIGKLLFGNYMYIMDENMKEVPEGSQGEIYIGGKGVALRYSNNAVLTKQLFIPDPFDSTKIIYKTGDFARMRPDGNVEYIARRTDQVKIAGFRVEIGEIQHALNAYPYIQDSYVFPVNTTPHEERPVYKLQAFVVPTPNAPSGDIVANIVAYLQPKLPHYMIPSIETVSKFKFNANGKVDFRVMLSDMKERTRSGPKMGNKEGVLVHIAEKVLQCSVEPTDNLLELGLNSILITQFVWKAAQLGISVPSDALFSSPTIRAVAQQLKNAEEAELIEPLIIEQTDKMPLTFGEKSLYTIQAMNVTSFAYNEAFLLHVNERIDIVILQAALAMVAERHPILRAQYCLDPDSGLPYKRFMAKANIPITCEDSSAPDEMSMNSLATERLTVQTSIPCNIEKGPLVKIVVVNGHSKSVIGVTMHHILCDGWSVALFSYELSAIYNAIQKADSRPSLAKVVAEVGLSEVVYAVPTPSEAMLAKNSAFWANELEGNEQFTELPMDFARPKTRSEKGGTYTFAIPQGVCDRLREYCQNNNITLFVALLSAYTAFIYRYSGSQKQFSIGIPTASRTPASRNLLGYFVNTLTMNMKIQDVTYGELTKIVQAQVLRCMAHKDMPVQKLMDAVDTPRVGNYNPFFQLMFVLNQPVKDYLQAAFQQTMPEGWAVEMPHLDISAAKFDLSFVMQEEEDGMSAQFQYSAELFKPSTIERMSEGFLTMLSGITQNPSVSITRIPCLTSTDKRLISKLNVPAVPLAVNSFTEMLTLQAKATPANAAFVKPNGRKFTYHEWDVCSSNLAVSLQEAGIKPGQIVAILTEFSFEYFVGVLGILKAGGVWLPIDPKAPLDRTNLTLLTNNIQAMVHTSRHSITGMELQGPRTYVMVQKFKKTSDIKEPEGFTMHVPASDDMCYMICTSGSTGTPKAVMVPHRGIVNYATWLSSSIPIAQSDVGMFPMALHFDGSMSLFATIASGAALYLHDPAAQLNMSHVVEEFCKHKITVVVSLPTWTNLLYSNTKEKQLAHVRFIGCGGDVIPQTMPDRILAASPNTKFMNFYGPTECSVVCIAYTYDKSKANGRALPIGKPILNMATFLLDENLQPVPIGVAGEICVGGTGVALGYYNAEKLSANAFVDTPHFPTKLYRTGDYGRMLPDGQLEFMARRDGQVKIFGYRIETSEIYNVLCKMDYVQDAVVVPVKVTNDDPNSKASYELRGFVVVTEEHCKESRGSVRKLITKYLQTKLPPYMIPKLNIMNEFPYAQSGKVDIRALLRQQEDNDNDQEMIISPRSAPPAPFVQPTSPTASALQDKVKSVFEEALGVASIGDKSIFDLGGDSITAVAIINKINAILGKQVPVISLFESGGTVSGLAEKLYDAPVMSAREIFINKIVDLTNQYGHKVRRKLFAHMRTNQDLFMHREDQTIEQQRDISWKRVTNLIQNKFLYYPTRETKAEYEAIIEAITMFDFTIVMLWRNQYLAVVQCLQYTGSEYHAELLQKVANFESTGAIALSELGHGSNTSQIETAAVFDKATDSYILNTPNDMAQKYWCGGASQFAINLIVVAKLYINGVDHGMHLFITPLRDSKGNITSGITVVDCGQKMGLNGVDNGRVWFHNLRLPRKGGMLDRFSQVNEKGEYKTVIPNVHLRNTAHLCEPLLVEGRLSIAVASTAISKTALATAVRYTASRNQFGPKNLPIIDALAVQLRLFPHIARVAAMNTLTKFMVRCNIHPSSDPQTGYTADLVAQLSSAVKPYCTWMSLQVLRDCREVCGGQGYRHVNRFGSLIGDAEGLCTAEGAGDLLVPIFGKSICNEWTKFTSGAASLSHRLKALEPLADEATRQQIHTKLKETKLRRTLIDPEFQTNAFLIREFELLTLVTSFYQENKQLDQFDADNMIASEMRELVFAHLERVALEQLLVLEPMVEADMLPLLEISRSMFVLDRLHNSPFSHLTLQLPRTVQYLVNNAVKDLCTSMKAHAVDLVDGFGVPDFLLGEAGNDWLRGNAEPVL